MKEQNYKNHVRYYYPHHFIFYPVILAGIIFSGLSISRHPETALEWKVIMGIFVLLGWLSFMMRQHYALTNQNRIVRLELRFRYYALTQKRLEQAEQKLSFRQLAALRFASDEELPALVERAVKENLSASDIKKSIKNWLPDHMRV